jgi:hypothetical protein
VARKPHIVRQKVRFVRDELAAHGLRVTRKDVLGGTLDVLKYTDYPTHEELVRHYVSDVVKQEVSEDGGFVGIGDKLGAEMDFRSRDYSVAAEFGSHASYLERLAKAVEDAARPYREAEALLEERGATATLTEEEEARIFDHDHSGVEVEV